VTDPLDTPDDLADNSLLSCELDTCTCGRRNFEHAYRELLDCLARDLVRWAGRRS
jgi:hypothetical protein